MMLSVTTLFSFALLVFAATGLATDDAHLWPTYRHDSSLAGFSPLRGGLANPPEVLWSVDLGGKMQPREAVQIRDVNGDGRDEVLRVQSDGIICQDLHGRQLWKADGLPNPVITDIRDYAGDGSVGILVKTNNWKSNPIYMVSGKTGHKSLLYTMQSVFGSRTRIGRILPDVPGQQICAWWDGWGEIGKGQKAHGYLWSFENGVEEPVKRFETEEDGMIFSANHLFADMDGDGKIEMVMITMEQMWLYDMETGAEKLHTKWEPGIRTYSAYIAAEPLKPGQLPSLLMINPHIPGVQVLTQDGKSAPTRLWKQVVGPLEDQYQQKITIISGAPDPFMDIDNDGQIEILTQVANEYGDGKTHLVIFGADNGERLFDRPGYSIVSVDDLDQDGIPEIIFYKDDELHIANWDGKDFVSRWQGDEAEPLLKPRPSEGTLNRSVNDPACCNVTIWREEPGSPAFLMRFGDTVWSCKLKPEGSLEKLRQVTEHQALGNMPEKTTSDETYSWDGRRLVTHKDEKEVARFEVPRGQNYMPPPALVGRLGGEIQIIIRENDGDLVSYSVNGKRQRVLVRKSPAFPHNWENQYSQASICDIDGDGENELLTTTAEHEGIGCVVAVDAEGNIKMQIEPIANATEVCVGATGSMGKGQGRWIMVAYRRALDDPIEIAYDGRTGKELWRRDSYGVSNDVPQLVRFGYPCAVYDYDGDGADDLIVSAGNYYGVLSVKDNRDLVPPVTLGPNGLPGHWVTRFKTLLVNALGSEKPQVFLCRANGVTVLMDMEGEYIWHYSLLPRENMPFNLEGFADLDGDGKIEIVTAHRNGTLRAFNAEPSDHRCPTCLPDEPLTDRNRSGQERWTFQIPAPINPSVYDSDQDFATADLDGDGKTELLLGGGDGKLYALKEVDGGCEILWSVDLGSYRVGSPILADLDGSGQARILVPTENGRMYCLGQAEGAAEKPSSGFGLTVDADGTLLRNGVPYRGFGVNYFSAFSRALLDPDDTSYEEGFKELASYEIPFARVMFTGFWPSNMELYMEDKPAYFQRMDAVVKSAEKNGIGLIPSLFWYDATVPDLVAEPRDQWGNPKSKTHAFMRNYTREVVTRYKDSPAIWGWELGNEYNLGADLPNAAEHRPTIVPHWGTPTTRSEHDDLTHEMLHTAFVEFAKEVRKYDSYRIILTGNSIPRASSWHQREENSWTKDSYEQMLEILAGQNPDPVDVISIHTYENAKDRIPQMAKMAAKLKKPLFVGEFGVPDSGAEAEAKFAALLATIEKERVPLAALWVYDLAMQTRYTVTGSNKRAYQLKALAEANERLWKVK